VREKVTGYPHKEEGNHAPEMPLLIQNPNNLAQAAGKSSRKRKNPLPQRGFSLKHQKAARGENAPGSEMLVPKERNLFLKDRTLGKEGGPQKG